MTSILTATITVLVSCLSYGGSLGDGLGNEAPTWLSNPPKNGTQIFSVGEARGIENRDDALERAWISSLLRYGMTQFPELGSLRSVSEESLHSATYNRKFILQLELIDWKGVSEVEARGSPHITYNETSKTYTVYRLLSWAKKDIAASKASLRRKRKNEIPPSPEVARKIEAEFVSEIQKIHALNQQIASRDDSLSKVLMVAKCGVTVNDLKNILGPPDRQDSICEHYWGTFKVFACRGPIQFITPKNGEGPRRSLCRSD